MRHASLLLAALLAAPGLARADAALVLANEDYATLPDLRGADAAALSTGGIEALGFEAVALADGGREDAGRALARFMARAPEAERLVVALTGRFATDGGRSWFLTADTPVPTLFGLNSNAVSVESLLAVLARHPSRAVLLLGVDEAAEGAFDPWLREGLGALAVPQGVTVLSASPAAVAGFLEDELARPGGDLAAMVRANPSIRADGYLPGGFAFMPEAAEPPTQAPAAPEPPAVTPAEEALWEGAVALGTVEAFRDYLRAYPEGAFAVRARAAVADILADPNRAARQEEEALRLSRDARAQVQRDLAALDYDPRGVDGIFGAGTRAAIVNWQQENGFPQSGFLDREQVGRLSDGAAEREAIEAAERQAAAEADDAAWARVEAAGNDLDALGAYLERYPDGRHAEEAADRVALIQARERDAADDALWARVERAGEDLDALGAYLGAYPEGRHADEAAERIARIEARRGQESAEADDALWARVEMAGDDLDALRAYLEAYPQGRHAAWAAERIARLEAREGARAAETALGLTPLTARVIEARLRALDLDPGRVDGTLDADARAALRRYQEERDLTVTGYLDEATIVRLLADTVGQALDD